MIDSFLAMFQGEEGQGLVEYALIIVLVAIAVMAILTTLGGSVTNVFTRISDALLAGSLRIRLWGDLCEVNLLRRYFAVNPG